MIKYILTILTVFTKVFISAQVGIGTVSPNSNAILDLNATNKGLLFPRLNTTQMNGIAGTPAGLTIYNIDTGCLCTYSGTKWINLCRLNSIIALSINKDSLKTNTGSIVKLPILDSTIYWKTTGNIGTTSSNFIGTKDTQSLRIKVNNRNSGYISNNSGSNTFFGYLTADSVTGVKNTAFGHTALQNLQAGASNVAFGFEAAKNTKSGNSNVAIGSFALNSNVAGSAAIAIGDHAMRYTNNTSTGFDNYSLAIGFEALRGSTTPSANTGVQNLAIGYQTLSNNTIGNSNVAIGLRALRFNTNGSGNTAIGEGTLELGASSLRVTAVGYRTLNANSVAVDNTAIGAFSLTATTTGSNNTAAGSNSLFKNTIGINNVSLGYNSMFNNSNGSENVAIGRHAMRNVQNDGNVGIGSQVLYDQSFGGYNTFTGFSAGFYMVRSAGGTAYGALSMYYGISSATNFLNTNTAVGYESIRGSATPANNIGLGNSALGFATMKVNTSGDSCTAIGQYALTVNTTGDINTALGSFALTANTTGKGNTALGNNTLFKNILGNYNLAIGNNASTTVNNLKHASAIGAFAFVDTSHTMIFGRKDSVFRWGFGRGKVNSGAFQVGSTTNDGNGAYLSTGGTWSNASDSSCKTQITHVNSMEILNQINALKITKWKYKGTNEFHIGPMAQDFYSMFKLGNNNTSISTIDPASISLIGIQQLSYELQKLQTENEELKKRLLVLEAKIK